MYTYTMVLITSKTFVLTVKMIRVCTTGSWQKLCKGHQITLVNKLQDGGRSGIKFWSVEYQLQVTLMGRLFWMELFKNQGRVTLRRILPSCCRMISCFSSRTSESVHESQRSSSVQGGLSPAACHSSHKR